jgi:hypothetical protein
VYYQKNNKQLAFVAAFHDRRELTFEKVREAIEVLNPEIVIVEGAPSSLGVNNPEIITLAREQVSENPILSGENLYSVYLADKSGFSFIAGEPDDDEILQYCLKKGYSLMDLMGFYLVRQIPQCKIDKIFTEPFELDSFEKFAYSFIEDNFGVDSFSFSLPEFYHWYKEVVGSCFDLKSIEYDQFEGLPENHLLIRLSIDLNQFRDQHLAKIIDKTCQQFDRVLIVYGAAHYIIHKPMLEETFGSFEVETLPADS